MPLGTIPGKAGRSVDPQARRPAEAITHFRRVGRPESGHPAEVTFTSLPPRCGWQAVLQPQAMPAPERPNGMTCLRFPLLALALVPASLVQAPAPALAQQSVITLDPVVLSGGLTPITESAYGRAYTTLTAEDLRERGNTTVQEALRGIPGLAVTSTGEALTKLRIRGSDYGHVLILIDGVEANTSNYGDYVFSGMLTEDIERIEVLRGPQSAVYGANAAGGVVSIITRKARTPGLSHGGSAEIGGQGTRAASVFVEAADTRGGLRLTLATRHTDGVDDSRTPGGDTEFNNRETLTLNGSYQLGEAVTAGFTLRRTWQEYGYDSTSWVPVASPADYVTDAPLTADRDETHGALWLEAEAMGGRMLNRLAFTAMNQSTDHFNAGVPDYDDASRLRALKYVATWSLDGTDAASAAQKLNLALETRREIYETSFSSDGRYERDSRSVAVEYQGRFEGGFSLQAGIRRNLNDDFRDTTSWSIAGAWQVPDRDLTLRAAAGRATVLPDMFQQFGYIPGSFTGNPDLRPETTLAYEIGADWGFAGDRGRLGATLFTGKVEDLIQGAGPTSVNIEGTSTRKGAELSLDYEVADWLRLGASYAYTDAHDADGVRISRQPRHQFGLRAGADFASGRGQVLAELRHVADSYDQEWFNTAWPDTPAMTKLPDFTTVNLAAQYDLTDNLVLTGRVVNLFDRDYSEAWGYYGPRRTAFVGVQARW